MFPPLEREKQVERIEDDGARRLGLPVAEGSPGEAGEGNQRIRLGDPISKESGVTRIPADDCQTLVVHPLEQGGLPEHEVVEHDDRISGAEKLADEDGADVASPAGNEDAFDAGASLPPVLPAA